MLKLYSFFHRGVAECYSFSRFYEDVKIGYAFPIGNLKRANAVIVDNRLPVPCALFPDNRPQTLKLH